MKELQTRSEAMRIVTVSMLASPHLLFSEAGDASTRLTHTHLPAEQTNHTDQLSESLSSNSTVRNVVQ